LPLIQSPEGIGKQECKNSNDQSDAFDTKASLIPDVTPVVLVPPTSPRFREAKEAINPNTVPRRPNNGARPIIVSKIFWNRLSTGISACDSLSNAAACRECNAKYPEAARRRGVEGRVEVAVDTDAQGNVTNVRVARSSGNRDLDEETVRQARDWKLKPAEGGRQGVSIATEFAIQGSRRSRQVQERKRQREAEERTQQTTAANSTEEAPKRRRRELTPSSNEVRATRPAISGFSRRLEPQTRESTASTTRTQGTARESLRRIRREQTANDSSQKPQPTANRRRRRDNSQNKLRDSLRRLRPQPQSQPAAPPATSQE
jgi:TonB family protein